MSCLPADHGSVGTRKRQDLLASALCLLIPLSGTAACVYEYPEAAQTPTTAPEAMPASTSAPATIAGTPGPYSDWKVLAREAKNYAELGALLRAPPEPVLLLEQGPLDGPLRGFGTTAKVPLAGQYAVTAACVGASGMKVAVGQEHPGAPFRPLELSLDCAGVTSQVIALQEGYVFAHLLLPGPGDMPWTGAVGGVSVTGTGSGVTPTARLHPPRQ